MRKTPIATLFSMTLVAMLLMVPVPPVEAVPTPAVAMGLYKGGITIVAAPVGAAVATVATTEILVMATIIHDADVDGTQTYTLTPIDCPGEPDTRTGTNTASFPLVASIHPNAWHGTFFVTCTMELTVSGWNPNAGDVVVARGPIGIIFETINP